jgi:predicted acyltransferase (DUF342 family)
LSFGFILFSALLCAWCLLHFAVARWALAKLKNSFTGEIDMNYVRLEDFKPRAVREGRISGAVRFSGDAALGTGTTAGATVADGKLTLLAGARATDFVDSMGEMRIGENCVVEGRATSATAIRLGAGASVRSCFAPEITICGPAVRNELSAGSPVSDANTNLTRRLVIPDGVASGGLEQLSADTWICAGDLESEAPVALLVKLVVIGSFSAGAGSELFEDLKATGNLSIGSDSVCHGNLVSGATLTLGAGCHFERVLHAAGDLRLGPNVRGEGPQAVVAYAAGRVLLSPGITVSGKIASGLEVLSLP